MLIAFKLLNSITSEKGKRHVMKLTSITMEYSTMMLHTHTHTHTHRHTHSERSREYIITII